jgi:hypothetical protein
MSYIPHSISLSGTSVLRPTKKLSQTSPGIQEFVNDVLSYKEGLFLINKRESSPSFKRELVVEGIGPNIIADGSIKANLIIDEKKLSSSHLIDKDKGGFVFEKVSDAGAYLPLSSETYYVQKKENFSFSPYFVLNTFMYRTYVNHFFDHMDAWVAIEKFCDSFILELEPFLVKELNIKRGYRSETRRKTINRAFSYAHKVKYIVSTTFGFTHQGATPRIKPQKVPNTFNKAYAKVCAYLSFFLRGRPALKKVISIVLKIVRVNV